MKLTEARSTLKRMPVLGPASVAVVRPVRKRAFPGSATYWEERYAAGQTSGAGSCGPLAQFKAAPCADDGAHERHRSFSGFVARTYPDWLPIEEVANPHPYEGDGTTGSLAHFVFYERRPAS